MIKIDKKQSKAINSLIRKSCCNCKDSYCLLLDDECVQLLSNQYLYCNYFKRAVLPLDEKLFIELCGEDKCKRCEMFNSIFIANSSKQKYCKRCKNKRQREASKNWVRNKRQKRAIQREVKSTKI